ncbi:MAG: UbiA-like polyprenyltransferase [Pirellulaceae bacterium]
MFRQLRHILEMIRFSHTVFALPFALLAAVMAWSAPRPDLLAGTPVFRWQDLIGILLCMVTARSAAMAFNRLADRKIDADNPRTANRHLPAGVLSVGAVLVFTAVCSLGFIASTLLFLPNRLPLFLSVPVLFFLFAYSYTKRFTTLAHFWLGTALMLVPIAAWIALRGQVVLTSPADVLPAWWLGLAILLWVAGFDIIYACQDVEFDTRTNLRSVPARWGVAASLRLAAVCHLGMLLLLFSLPFVPWLGGPPLGWGWIYWTGIVAVSGLLCYEHWIVRPDDLTRVNTAFLHVNAIISIGLFAIGTLDLLT